MGVGVCRENFGWGRGAEPRGQGVQTHTPLSSPTYRVKILLCFYLVVHIGACDNLEEWEWILGCFIRCIQ